MKITAESLNRKWESINYFDGGYSQVETTHLIEWYIGFKEINQKTILLITSSEPESFISSKSILATKGKRNDGRWVSSLALLRAEQESVFEALCADLITYSQNANEEQEAIKLTVLRLKQWNKLLENQRKSLMDENNRKGLLGELIFLKEIIDEGCPVYDAVQSWVGPEGADQDFVFAKTWYEIKANGKAATTVGISSLEQLSSPDQGELVIMRIDKSAPESNGSISLGGFIDGIRHQIGSGNDCQFAFENKLMKYGYIDLPEYYEQKYLFSGKERFRVDQSFPRLTAARVPTQITAARYFISIASIEDWRIK